MKKETLASRPFSFLNRVTKKDLVIMSRQLATMLEAGLSIVESLRILVSQTTNPKLKDILVDVTGSVEGGAKLSDALVKYPKAFSKIYVSLVRTGETVGQLDKVLTEIADQEEKDFSLMSEIKGALMYPIFIIGGIIVVGIIAMIFVIPQLLSVLVESGVKELPLATRILMAVSNFLTAYWWLIILIIVASVFGFRAYIKTSEGRRNVDMLKLKVPVFGKLYKELYVTRIANSLNGLIKGGTPIVRSLNVTSEVVGNVIYQEILLETAQAVEQGRTISSVLAKREEMPVMVSQMIAVGEETGKVADILGRIANFYTNELDATIKGMIKLIEPVVLVIIGVAVFIMVSAVLMPMYNLASAY